jgi:hypothetical protein
MAIAHNGCLLSCNVVHLKNQTLSESGLASYPEFSLKNSSHPDQS